MQAIKWGYGAAPLLRPVTKEDTELVAFVSDFHVPYQDNAAVNVTMKFLKKMKPHRIILNGDFNDFFTISKYNMASERLDALQDEIDESNVIRKRIRKAAPNAEIIEVPGNHDVRLTNYVAANARALTSLRALEPRALLLHDELEFSTATSAGIRVRKNFMAYHGTKISQHAGYTAKAELEKNGISGTSGHCHRLSTYIKSGYETKTWAESGGLMRLDPDYQNGAINWQQGLVLGQFSTKTDSFMLELVQIQNGIIYFGGKQYS
jgi:predicted phosphodiesterase